MIPEGLIGVIHLGAMPGEPRNRGASFDDVLAAAMRDVDALVQGGITQMIVENFGSSPFRRGTLDDPVDPHTHVFLGRVAEGALGRGAIVGINCLRNDGHGSIGVAAAVGASFVRINVLSGAYVTDQGVIESDAARVLRYRQSLDAESVAILADVLVKHAAPLGHTTLRDAISDTIERAGADAIIVSGRGTGEPTDVADLEVARECTDAPLLVGSGLTLQSAPVLRPLIDGAIVGTALKVGGRIEAPVDVSRVTALVEAWGAA